MTHRSVELSVSSEMEQVERNFPDANDAFNSLLIGGISCLQSQAPFSTSFLVVIKTL